MIYHLSPSLKSMNLFLKTSVTLKVHKIPKILPERIPPYTKSEKSSFSSQKNFKNQLLILPVFSLPCLFPKESGEGEESFQVITSESIKFQRNDDH